MDGADWGTSRAKNSVGRLAWTAAMAIVAPAGLAAQDRCEHRDVKTLSGPANGSLEVHAGAGELAIEGRSGISEIRVTAVLCASSQERLDELSVALVSLTEDDTERGRRTTAVVLDGDRLTTDYPSANGRWGARNYATINLEVEVPLGTDVDVEDQSGSTSVSGVGRLRIEDGSGSTTVRDAGAVMVKDGSGSLRIEDVDGDVHVEDGSGSLEIQRVGGAVEVSDGAGSLRIREVANDVEVSDGSGSIEIEAVGGSVRVEEMSGGLSVRDVAGDLVVSGGRRERIRYSNVRGSLDLPPARRKGRGPDALQ